jgi:hypothetical protein
VKLFVDEDAGATLAIALLSTGLVDLDYVANDRHIKTGTYDEDWIPYAGQHGMLVPSQNKRMLRVQGSVASSFNTVSGSRFYPIKPRLKSCSSSRLQSFNGWNAWTLSRSVRLRSRCTGAVRSHRKLSIR